MYMWNVENQNPLRLLLTNQITRSTIGQLFGQQIDGCRDVVRQSIQVLVVQGQRRAQASASGHYSPAHCARRPPTNATVQRKHQNKSGQ